MKRILLLTGVLLSSLAGFGQNINDNKVAFKYIQLPMIKIDESFTTYQLQISHLYRSANEDSLQLLAARETAAQEQFEREKSIYRQKKLALQRSYLSQLAAWEKQVNAGAVDAAGQPIAKPIPPIMPTPPEYPEVIIPRLHTDYNEALVNNGIALQGFQQGTDGVTISIGIEPIQNIRIVEKKKGSGTSTKYKYTCRYTLPISLKLETPSQGTLLETTILKDYESYEMKQQKSRYDHEIYMLDNSAQFFADLEKYARNQAIRSAQTYLNDQFGYVEKTRNAEVYSVKKFKNYDYSDVTNAYTATAQALNLIGRDRDCETAQSKLENALALWKEIMMESNTFDKKARINDKISAMVQCNIAEIELWRTNFNTSDATLNHVLNSGVLKAKNHARRVRGFYDKRRKRWEVNY